MQEFQWGKELFSLSCVSCYCLVVLSSCSLLGVLWSLGGCGQNNFVHSDCWDPLQSWGCFDCLGYMCCLYVSCRVGKTFGARGDLVVVKH